jgi:hypothetical protein
LVYLEGGSEPLTTAGQWVAPGELRGDVLGHPSFMGCERICDESATIRSKSEADTSRTDLASTVTSLSDLVDSLVVSFAVLVAI